MGRIVITGGAGFIGSHLAERLLGEGHEVTYALVARNGKHLWNFRDGKYAGVVADAERLYLVGHARVYGLVER